MKSRVLQFIHVVSCISTGAAAITAGKKRLKSNRPLKTRAQWRPLKGKVNQDASSESTDSTQDPEQQESLATRLWTEQRLQNEVKKMETIIEKPHSNPNSDGYERAVRLALQELNLSEASELVVNALNEAGRPLFCDFERVMFVLGKIKEINPGEQRALYSKLVEQYRVQAPCYERYIQQPELDGRTLTITMQMPEDDGLYGGVPIVISIDGEHYPLEPPKVTLKTKNVDDVWTSLSHPNVEEQSGHLEIVLFRKDVWSPYLGIHHILCHIVRLLMNPLAEPDSIRNTTAANLVQSVHVARKQLHDFVRRSQTMRTN